MISRPAGQSTRRGNGLTGVVLSHVKDRLKHVNSVFFHLS